VTALLRSAALRRAVAGMSGQEEVTVGTSAGNDAADAGTTDSPAVTAQTARTAVTAGIDDAAAFHEFFERHYADLARLAHLLTGEADAADDLAADALVAVWRHWERVRAAEHPAAYARGVVANLARSRIRSAVRERRRVALFWSQRGERAEEPDMPAVLDLREALQRLPFRKRACVVLRHAFDLSEKDTAAALGISVGTVKSQTSRGVAELERLLAPPPEFPTAALPPEFPTAAGPVPGPSGTVAAVVAVRTGTTGTEDGTVPAPGSPPTGGAAARPAGSPASGPAPTAAPASAPVSAAAPRAEAGCAADPPGAWGGAAPAGAAAAQMPSRGRATAGLAAVSGLPAAGGRVGTGRALAVGGSAPARKAAAEAAGATRIPGSTSPATRAPTPARTGRGL
jgi:RNA polymerase sigma-70 factor (sigma-E family)